MMVPETARLQIGEVKLPARTPRHLSGNPTNQDLASQNVPTSLLTQNNFRFAGNPSAIDVSANAIFPSNIFESWNTSTPGFRRAGAPAIGFIGD
jgi:hypothetical protein